jgi:hypothetical protein
MKRRILVPVLAVLMTAVLFSSCTKEEVKPKAEGGVAAVRDKL